MGSIPGLDQWVKDLALLWLWHKLAAVAPIQVLAWEPPYAVGAALKKTKKKKKKKEILLSAFKNVKMVSKDAVVGSSQRGSVETNLTSIHEDAGWIPGLAQWFKDPLLL